MALGAFSLWHLAAKRDGFERPWPQTHDLPVALDDDSIALQICAHADVFCLSEYGRTPTAEEISFLSESKP